MPRLSVGSKADAFQPVRNSFQPEQLDKLTEAFNLVWTEIMLAQSGSNQRPTRGLRWPTSRRQKN
jgi:hypothetical protein